MSVYVFNSVALHPQIQLLKEQIIPEPEDADLPLFEGVEGVDRAEIWVLHTELWKPFLRGEKYIL